MARSRQADSWAEEIGLTRPQSGRVYDYWLGGKNHFNVDREVARAIAHEALWTLPAMAQENRRFMHRVTRYLAGACRVNQFLDIGAGVPMSPNVHEVAQTIDPTARVVYVENDRIIHLHNQALMTSVSPGLGVVDHVLADLTEPKKLLAEPAIQQTLDLDRPVALMLLAVLSSVTDEEDPWECVRVLMDAVPSGSYLAISQLGSDFAEQTMEKVAVVAAAHGLRLALRTRDQVERFFDGWELVEPGVVSVSDWRPDDDPEESRAYYWGGVARKP